MKYTEIEKKSEKDLHALLAEKREELRELRFKLAANQLKQVHKVKDVKQLIARIQTRLRQLALEEKEA